MTFAVLIVLAVGATVGAWVAHLRTSRTFRRNERLYDQRYERAEQHHRNVHEVDRRELDALRDERNVLTERIATSEQMRASVAIDALATKNTLARTTEQLAANEARLAHVERQRLDVGYQSEQLTATLQRQVAELATAHRRISELEAARRRGAVEAVDREQQLSFALHQARARAEMLAISCQLDAEPATPIYVDRPAPRELDAIAARIRGLTLVDCVTVADGRGLSLDRAMSRDADDLAALAPAANQVARTLDHVVGTVRGIVIYTSDARVVELRALPTWTAGSWLVAQSSAQRPSPSALDAAVAYAFAVRDALPVVASAVQLTNRGRLGPRNQRSEALGDELDRATRGFGARTVALVLGDQLLAGTAMNGLGTSELSRVTSAVSQVQQAARAGLHTDDVARIEIDFVGGMQISIARLGMQSRLSLLTVTVGRALDPLELERIVGRLRRFLDDNHGLDATHLAAGAAS